MTVLVILGAIYYALEGGEYGTGDLVRQRARQREMLSRIDSLKHAVDSLSRLKRALATDAALQERIARENWTMVRGDKELVYRFLPPGRGPRP